MDEQLEKLVKQVQEGIKYRSIHPELVENIASTELKKGRSWKDTVKATRNKLHQVGSAYQIQPIDYERLTSELKTLPKDIHNSEVRRFLIQTMSLHASTRERLIILDQFYAECFTSISPVDSILDLACGLNPLALAWMPISERLQMVVCDIYTDQIEFLNEYFTHFQINGRAFCCDLTQHIPKENYQVALVLKTIPCLEQIDKNIGSKILKDIQCQHLLVSFPAQSLTGKNKGMRQFYSDHFQLLLQHTDWTVKTFAFSNEQAFLVIK